MPTDPESPIKNDTQLNSFFTLREVAALLVKDRGLHEGLFDLTVEFKIGTGAVGPDRKNSLPGLAVGVSRLGLKKVSKAGANTVNAAEVNPARKRRKASS